MHNSCLPIARLSDDLLEVILLEVSSSSLKIMATGDALGLSHICRWWRGVALRSGRLWARPSGGPALFELSLERSLSAPLYLEIDTRRIKRTGPVFGQGHRIIEMSLFVASDVVTGQQVAPALRTLQLSFAPEMTESSFLAGWNMPQLDRLTLVRTSLRSNGHLLLNTLSSLELVSVDCHDTADALGCSLFFRAVRQLRALKSLRLVDCFSEEFLGIPLTQAPIRLPALKILDLTDEPELCLGFLRSIDVASVSPMSLDFSGPITRVGFPRDLSASIRRHSLERDGDNPDPFTICTASLDFIDGRLCLAFWSAHSANAEPLLDTKPAIQIVFNKDNDVWDATNLASHLSLQEDIRCLRIVPRVMAKITPVCLTEFDDVFRRVETLVLGQAAYQMAGLMFSMDSSWTRNKSYPGFYPLLRTLVLADIQHRDDEVTFFNELAETFVTFLQERYEVGQPVQTVAINDCSVFRRADIEEIKLYVHDLLWDGQAMDECW